MSVQLDSPPPPTETLAQSSPPKEHPVLSVLLAVFGAYGLYGGAATFVVVTIFERKPLSDFFHSYVPWGMLVGVLAAYLLSRIRLRWRMLLGGVLAVISAVFLVAFGQMILGEGLANRFGQLMILVLIGLVPAGSLYVWQKLLDRAAAAGRND